MASPVMRRSVRGRFAFVYGVLATLGVLAVGAGLYELGKPGPPAPATWPWTPSGSAAEEVRQIAAHVSAEYSAPGGSNQLDMVRGGALQSQSQVIRIAKTTKIQNRVQLLDGSAVQYQLCGPNKDCSVPTKEATLADPLMRRQGLELALYTFRNVPSVSNVVVFLPPPPHQDRSRAMVFQRNDVAALLDEPLKLPGQSTELTLRQAISIAQRTDPFMFHFTLSAVSGSDGTQTPAIVVDPEGLDANTDQSTPPPTSSTSTSTTPTTPKPPGGKHRHAPAGSGAKRSP